MARREKGLPTLDQSEDIDVLDPPSIDVVALEPPEEKIKFLVWFSGALERFPRLKPHHLQSVQAYFKNIGLSDFELDDQFDVGLSKFGYGKR